MKAVRLLVLSLVVLSARPCPGQPLVSPDQHLVIGRLPCRTSQNPRAHGIRQLVWELMKRTSIDAEMESVPVDPREPALFRTPFLLWSCEGPVEALPDKAYDNLRRFLVLGGFLLIDDPSGTPGGDFERSARAALTKLFPDRRLSEISLSHVLFKTFFLIDRPVGRLQTGQLQSVDIGGRLAVVYSPNDLLGAASKDFYGSWEHHCEPGGEHQREMSFRLGINLIFYALCQDYKDDRVHLPFILRRRKQ